MTDQELLELAANAAGMGDLESDISGFYRVIGEHEDGQKCMVEWNPITDDGDALRLAVTLGLRITPYPIYAEPKTAVIVRKEILTEDCDDEPKYVEVLQQYKSDPCAATCRAIVRAAAMIGGGK